MCRGTPVEQHCNRTTSLENFCKLMIYECVMKISEIIYICWRWIKQRQSTAQLAKNFFKLQRKHTLRVILWHQPMDLSQDDFSLTKLTAPKNHHFELLEKFRRSPKVPEVILESKSHLSQPTNFESKYIKWQKQRKSERENNSSTSKTVQLPFRHKNKHKGDDDMWEWFRD